MASYPKVENVVKAPQKPIPSNNQLHSGMMLISFRPVKTPNKNDPAMFMNKVGYGNEFPVFFPIHNPARYLHAAPTAPPIPTSIIKIPHPFFANWPIDIQDKKA